MKTTADLGIQPLNMHGAKDQKKADPKALAKEVETLFVNEFLKVMFEHTSFGKDKMTNNFLPFITEEISKTVAERGMGIGDFVLRGPSLSGLTSGKVAGNAASQSGDAKGAENGLPLHNTPALKPFSRDGKLKLPVSGAISSRYGLRLDPIKGGLKQHNGVDIAVPEGTQVRPAAPGKIVFSGYSEGYGNCVIVEHEGGVTSIYGHNSANLVKEGDIVDKTSVIALSGSTGRSTGPHVHFEVRKKGAPVDPMDMIG